MKKEEEIIKKFSDLYDRAEHRVNVLDFAPMNENAHTSFLGTILRHEHCGKQIFIKSFLKRIFDCSNDGIDFVDEKFDVKEQVTINNGRVLDLCLESKSQYIVLENKVCLASDGDRQMLDYWKHCELMAKKSHKKPRLIYLTLAGGAPADWSLDEKEHQVLVDNQCYFEASYRDEVLAWLKEDVLPNCLYSEACLVHSISLYVDRMARKVGGDVDECLASQAAKFLSHVGVLKGRIPDDSNNENFDVVCKLCEKLEKKADKRSEDRVKFQKAFEVATTLKHWFLSKCVYLDPGWTAYNLKWILKNNPTLEYKNRGRFNVGAFVSIGQFTYYGDKFVQLATKEGFRIHINCHCFKSKCLEDDADGIKQGPYVFPEIFDLGISRKDLESQGFIASPVWGDKYHFPMPDFDPKKTGLEEVARHIEKMIRVLEKLTPKLR